MLFLSYPECWVGGKTDFSSPYKENPGSISMDPGFLSVLKYYLAPNTLLSLAHFFCQAGYAFNTF